ncbi:MAG: transglycosylase SLT domain-containing protein [Acidobacteriaceae bacterium]|nr:transglycosylase SLT domain-containing protein [Acidobacteriaceae bacterium]
MRESWEPNIRGSCFSLWERPFSRRAFTRVLCLSAAIVGLAFASAHGAGPKKKKAQAPATKVQPPKVVGAAGLISVAQHELNLGHFTEAATYATSAAGKAPMLKDYAYYIREQAEFGLKNYSDVNDAAVQVFDQEPKSPFVGAAAALAVESDLDGDRPKSALELIEKYADVIPHPQSDLLLAKCYAATGDLEKAADYYQRVYYGYPSSTKDATDAANALVDVKQKLGDKYPAPTPAAILGRGAKLLEEKNWAAARIELAAAIPQLSGAQADLARVRLGETDFLSKNNQAAFEYLLALKVDDPEADAERLSYIIRCARKADKHADINPYLTTLETQHPNSPWRLDALIFVADQARTENDAHTYLPLYQACASTFAKDPRAAWCHWRVAFESYRTDSADAYDLLRAHVEQYPDSMDADNALYFLGRLLERKNDNASARACYQELTEHFPNTYFAIAARERLKSAELQAATATPKLVEFLHPLKWPAKPEFPSFEPGPVAQERLTRAQLLHLTGLDEWAEGELKFGARADGEQENVYTLQLAKYAAERNAPDQALHYIKTYTPGYLYMPLDEAPLEYWEFAFPIPYRNSIVQYSRDEGLDPYLVAALIRQESEFNERVISHANAYGLMQLLPATGKQLARHFGIRRFNSSQLLMADRNIELGAYYFRNLLNSYGGQAEIALASYNAGPGRANLWQTWGPFKEPAEFVEVVPFHETRGYVQIVMRNADVYRRLYGSTVPDLPVYRPKPAPKTKARKRTHRRAS